MRFRNALTATFTLLALLAPAAGSAAPPPAPAPAEAAPQPSWSDRLYYGGSVGASFGDVDYLSITPMIGYSFNPKISAGVSLFYVHRDDSRYNPDLTTNDYGFELFGRYRIAPPVFAEVRYSHWSYEVFTTAGGTDRDSYDGYLLGGGFVQPLGGRSSFYVSALYDFNYSDDSPSPYDDPWVVSFGVTFGF